MDSASHLVPLDPRGEEERRTYGYPYNESVLMHAEIPLSPPPIPNTPPLAHPPISKYDDPFTHTAANGNADVYLPPAPPAGQSIPPHVQAPIPHRPPPAGVPYYTQPYPPPPRDDHTPDFPFTQEHIPGRSPSPTPSELEEANQPFFSKNWKEWIKQPKSWFYIFIAVVFIAIAITFGVLHDQIARDLQPTGAWLRSKSWGFIIPIAIMIVISFPPLFGQELVGLLVGDFYGLWVGFAIVAAGTLIGEILNFFVFRYLCFARGKKLENKSFFYACVSSAIRGGGFKIAALARYSAIPAHFTTTVFATCGMGFWTFLAAAIVSLPKQLGTVSAGALLASSENGGKANKLPSYILFALTVVATIIAQRYMRKKIDEHRLVVVREKRRARAAVSGSASDFNISGEAAREMGNGASGRGKDGKRGKTQQFWKKMTTGEVSHAW